MYIYLLYSIPFSQHSTLSVLYFLLYCTALYVLLLYSVLYRLNARQLETALIPSGTPSLHTPSRH